jgi:hypothetical protein
MQLQLPETGFPLTRIATDSHLRTNQKLDNLVAGSLRASVLKMQPLHAGNRQVALLVNGLKGLNHAAFKTI